MEAIVRAQIREYIVSTWLNGDDRGFDDNTDLQENGILDSFATLALTAFLDETFHLQLDPKDIHAGTFRSVESLVRLVLEKVAATNAAPA